MYLCLLVFALCLLSSSCCSLHLSITHDPSDRAMHVATLNHPLVLVLFCFAPRVRVSKTQRAQIQPALSLSLWSTLLRRIMQLGDVILAGHDVVHVSFQHEVELHAWIVPRVDVAVVQLAGGVVHIAMFCLVGTHGVHEVQDGALLSQMPVRARDVWCRLVLPGGQVGTLWRLLDGLDDFGVRHTGFFLNVSHEAVTELGAHQVGEEEGAAKSKLREDDRGTEHGGRVLHLDEREEMHAFVVRLLEEEMQQTTIALHGTQALEVSADGGDHAWHGGDRLEEDHAVQDLVSRDGLVVPARGGVEEEAHDLHCVQSRVVQDAGRFFVRQLDIEIFGSVGCVGFAVDVLRAAVATQDGMAVGTGCGIVQCNNEVLVADAATGLSGVEELSEFHDFLVCEGSMMLLEEEFEVAMIESSILVVVRLSKLCFDLLHDGHLQLLQSACDRAELRRWGHVVGGIGGPCLWWGDGGGETTLGVINLVRGLGGKEIVRHLQQLLLVVSMTQEETIVDSVLEKRWPSNALLRE
mmetsp:Transcript_5207/g.14012  ORF Transcript_5207/g.14012 Transcript_5207/m.14012 type:complete len:522 (+) Transcript_5207:63-1628(+)